MTQKDSIRQSTSSPDAQLCQCFEQSHYSASYPSSISPPLASTIHPSPLAGAGGGQDAKLLALVQSLQQRLDDVESTAAHTIIELGQVKKNLVVTETKVDTLQGGMISLYNQTTAFQVEQRELAGLAAENMSKLMLKLSVSSAAMSLPAPRRQPNLNAISIREAGAKNTVVDFTHGNPGVFGFLNFSLKIYYVKNHHFCISFLHSFLFLCDPHLL